MEHVPSQQQHQSPGDSADPAATSQSLDQADSEGGGGPAGDGHEEGEDTLVVTVCSMGADGTFEVTVKRDALVDDLVDAIAESRGIVNARRLVAVHVAGEAEPLAGTQSVAGRMAEAGVGELFMLLRACDDRRVLEEIYNGGGNSLSATTVPLLQTRHRRFSLRHHPIDAVDAQRSGGPSPALRCPGAPPAPRPAFLADSPPHPPAPPGQPSP